MRYLFDLLLQLRATGFPAGDPDGIGGTPDPMNAPMLQERLYLHTSCKPGLLRFGIISVCKETWHLKLSQAERVGYY